MIRIHYQVGNGYNSSPQIVTYILQKAFFKHALEVGVFLLEKDKYTIKNPFFQARITRISVTLHQHGPEFLRAAAAGVDGPDQFEDFIGVDRHNFLMKSRNG